MVSGGFCGAFGNTFWVNAGTPSPCVEETTAGGVLLAISLLCFLFQGWRLALIARIKQTLSQHPEKQRGIRGINGAFIAGALFLIGVHSLHLTTSIAVLRDFPFHIIYHACMAGSWLMVAAMAMHTARMRISLDSRAFIFPACAAYLVSFYIYLRLYSDPHHLPMAYIKACVWTILLQTAACIGLAVLEVKRMRVAQPYLDQFKQATAEGGLSGELIEPLLLAQHAQDVEAADRERRAQRGASGGGADDDEEEQSWISLFVSAVVYVW